MLLSKCCGLGQSLDSKKNIDLSTLPHPSVFSKAYKKGELSSRDLEKSPYPESKIPHPAGDHGWMLSKRRL